MFKIAMMGSALAAMMAASAFAQTVTNECQSVTVTPLDNDKVQSECVSPTLPNQPPVANADTNSGISGTTLSGNVLTNDTDPDAGDTLTVISGSGIAPNGDYSQNQATPGEVVVSYIIDDGNGNQASSTLTLTWTNQNPVVQNDTISGNIPFNAQGNVLSNDSDPDGGTLSIQQPNANINADGSFNIPHSTEGEFDYPYTVIDGQGGSATGNLHVQAIEVPPPTGLVAFPGAEGFGRFATGGRGGAVIYVTNTADSGAGSLRACIDASGPRTCIFRTSGYIVLANSLDIVNPFITIAGETAPGQGITLRNGTNIRQGIRFYTHDIIVRHIRFRPGGPHHSVGSNGDGFIIAGNNSLAETENVTDIILDHVSSSWGTDETADASPFYDRVTIQNSMFYEGLKTHSKGPNIRGCGISLIENLIASNTIRNPNHTCGKEVPGSIRVGGSRHGEVEFRNNVVYNGNSGFLDFWNGRGEGWGNYAGNVFKRGPDTPGGNTAPYPIDVYDFESSPGSTADFACPGGTGCTNWKPAGTSDPQHICVMQNADMNDVSGPRTPPIHGVLDPRDAHVVHSTDCVNNPAVDPDEPRGLTGAVVNAAANPTSAMNAVLADVGAFPNNRDTADAKIVTDTVNGTGSIPTCTQSGNNCSGLPYPTLAGGSNYPDTDTDGMDDTWEGNVGGMSATASGDHDSDGYTNLEEFLHFMAATR